jgi:hypothetical protein
MSPGSRAGTDRRAVVPDKEAGGPAVPIRDDAWIDPRLDHPGGRRRRRGSRSPAALCVQVDRFDRGIAFFGPADRANRPHAPAGAGPRLSQTLFGIPWRRVCVQLVCDPMAALAAGDVYGPIPSKYLICPYSSQAEIVLTPKNDLYSHCNHRVPQKALINRCRRGFLMVENSQY